jgi:hypothetical protein
MNRKLRKWRKRRSFFSLTSVVSGMRRYIQNFPDWVDNETNNNNKHSLRSNTKGYGGKTH